MMSIEKRQVARHAPAVYSKAFVCLQGGTEMLLSDEGRVNKFNSRYGGLGAYGKPGPVTPGGDKKLEYKKPQPGKKGKGKGKK